MGCLRTLVGFTTIPQRLHLPRRRHQRPWTGRAFEEDGRREGRQPGQKDSGRQEQGGEYLLPADRRVPRPLEPTARALPEGEKGDDGQEEAEEQKGAVPVKAGHSQTEDTDRKDSQAQPDGKHPPLQPPQIVEGKEAEHEMARSPGHPDDPEEPGREDEIVCAG